MKQLDLSGRTALVFGGVGNLGVRIASKLREHDANVAISYYNGEENKAASYVKELDSDGEKAFTAFCDISDESSVEGFVRSSKDRFRTIDIVVNLIHEPAFTPTEVVDMVWDDWKSDLIAQKGHFLICKQVLPIMREQKFGRIIYISAGLAVRHMGGSAAFACVKSGLSTFSKTLAIEEGRNNITVNIVAPGRITTLDTDGSFSWDEAEKELLKRTPLGRFATQDDVANAVLYFASPLADAMTGQTLYVACGEIML